MTEAADLICTNAEVHTLAPDGDEQAEAVAVRDGEIVRVDSAYEVAFLEGAETEVLDLDGRVLLPGFVDAHTHLRMVGRYQVDADLSAADDPGDCIELLREVTDAHDDWVLGFGYDESTWSERRYLTRADLDAVSEERPVAAFREDMHLVSLNGVALDRLNLPPGDVRTENGTPTGVVVESAAEVVRQAIAPSTAEARDLLRAAQDRAHELGVTAIHDMVQESTVARAYRDLDHDDELRLRVRLNYWASFLDSVRETGLRTNHGSEFVRTGAIKTFTDGSIGGRTAKLSTPYGDDPDSTGQWVVPPEELQDLRAEVEREELQAAVHAIGDEAIAAVVEAFADADPERRHRIEHAEVLTDELVTALAEGPLVVSAQPNFLKWARSEGLYEDRLGEERTRDSNRFGALLEQGATLAFGSDCMPMDPLLGVAEAVTAPADQQRLSVTDALRAYTHGAAYAGFDEDRMGTVEGGKKGDLVALEESPWATDDVADIDVALTVVDGDVVYDGR